MILNLLLAAGSLMSCDSNALLEPEFPEVSIIEGDTVKIRDDKRSLELVPRYETAWFFDNTVVGDTVIPFTPAPVIKPSRYPDLSKLKNNAVAELAGKPFKLVSAGGDMAFGRRDGGFFNEGMLTAYPTLIANQMGVEFKNPLFDKEDFNGYRRNVETTFNPTGGPVPKRKQAVNNLAVRDGKFKVYSGEMDNYYLGSYVDARWGNKVRDWTQSSYYAFAESYDKQNKGFGYSLKENKLKFDFVIVDIGLQNLFGNPVGLGGNSFWEPVSLEELQKTTPGDKVDVPGLGHLGLGTKDTYPNLFRLLVSQSLNRGLIINCPDLQDLPYFAKNYSSDVWEVIRKYKVLEEYSWLANGDRRILGSTKIDSVLAPNVNINIKPGIRRSYYNSDKDKDLDKTVVAKDLFQLTLDGVTEVNKKAEILREYSQMAFFDINAFYKRINRGGVTTDDGVEIVARWPGGNFFSTDGIFPSAFGQAVIANEMIKVINKHYNVNIELVPTKAFLNESVKY